MWPTECTEGNISCKTYHSPVREVFVFPFNREGNTGTQKDTKPVRGCLLGLGGDGIKKSEALDSKFYLPGVCMLSVSAYAESVENE